MRTLNAARWADWVMSPWRFLSRCLTVTPEVQATSNGTDRAVGPGLLPGGTQVSARDPAPES